MHIYINILLIIIIKIKSAKLDKMPYCWDFFYLYYRLYYVCADKHNFGV